MVPGRQAETRKDCAIMPKVKNPIDNSFPLQQRLLGSVLLKRRILGLLLVGLSIIGSLAIAAPSTLRITIGTFAPYYSPTFVHINTGTSISWENPTSALHSITHDECKNGALCAFNSGPLGPKSTFTIHQLSPGSYSYHCSFHPIMRGVLVVQESDSPNEA
jgi:plastocyanin